MNAIEKAELWKEIISSANDGDTEHSFGLFAGLIDERIKKDILREKIDEMFTFMNQDVSDYKLTIHKSRLLKDLLNEEAQG